LDSGRGDDFGIGAVDGLCPVDAMIAATVPIVDGAIAIARKVRAAKLRSPTAWATARCRDLNANAGGVILAFLFGAVEGGDAIVFLQGVLELGAALFGGESVGAGDRVGSTFLFRVVVNHILGWVHPFVDLAAHEDNHT
jgi:hypothetical protein